MSLVREAPVLVFEFEEMGLIRKISAWKILSKKGIRRSPLLVHTTSDGCTNGSVQEDITKRKAFGITNWRTGPLIGQCSALLREYSSRFQVLHIPRDYKKEAHILAGEYSKEG